ncbi:hypothetical protein GCM10022389_13330 [Flavobacterium cheonanense]|uniref:Uncharacterized protein n=1 Tax=Flavobacterium cheonanense TaxID=706183 RepID=A0ABP7VLR5_9FLAO
MKKTYLLFFLFSISFSFSQTNEKELNEIVEAEMKSASGLMELAVNPNTLNYDVTYQN